MHGSREGIGGPDPPEHLKLNAFLYKKAFGPPWKNGTPSESLEKHINNLRTQKAQSMLFSSRRNWIQRGSNFFRGGGGVQMLISIETHAT